MKRINLTLTQKELTWIEAYRAANKGFGPLITDAQCIHYLLQVGIQAHMTSDGKIKIATSSFKVD